MSGPVASEDAAPAGDTTGTAGATGEQPVAPVAVAGPVLEITPSREAQVGAVRVRRALPRRDRRTVGAWCFVDHMGPVTVSEAEGVNIGPHPHLGLQTVTWLVAGEVLHRDSLGSEQVIRPGQLNLMTAGGGVAHAEEATGRYRGEMHGVQLWVAQPGATRHGEAAFEHHAELPRVALGDAEAAVLVGTLAGTTSPARRDTDHLGAELTLRRGRAVVPLQPAHEHALVVLDGAVSVDGQVVVPGQLAYLGLGRDELALDAAAPARALLLGGAPFPERVLMWWNYVARTRDEIDAAAARWRAGDDELAVRGSKLGRIDAPATPWSSR